MTATAVDPAFWDAIADKYSKKPVDNPEAFDRKIEITQSKMTPESVVLDIGCGTGSLALRLASSGRHLHGLDLSPEMIRIANEKARAQQVDNVTFHTGPFDESFSAFEPESLDGICAYSILHLVPDRQDALQRIHRMLKPGGFFISSTVCLAQGWVPYRPMLTVMRWLGKAPVVHIVSKRQVADEIRAAGFVDLSEPDVGAQKIVGFVVARKPD